MASNPLTFTLTPGMAPAASLMRLLGRFDRRKVEAFAEISIALLDLIDGDADAQDTNDAEDDFAFTGIANAYTDGGPGCIAADPDACAYVEWHTKPANLRRHGQAEILGGHEDDELDDHGEDDDPAEDDDPDFGIEDVPHDQEHEAEVEQMLDDVPVLAVFSEAYNIFTDARVPLGYSNLMTSFIGQKVRSADTGAVHSTRTERGWPEPGIPV